MAKRIETGLLVKAITADTTILDVKDINDYGTLVVKNNRRTGIKVAGSSSPNWDSYFNGPNVASFSIQNATDNFQWTGLQAWIENTNINLSWGAINNGIDDIGFIGTSTNQPMTFRANNTEAVRILPSGNVGIGTNAPSAKLHLKGAGSTSATNSMKVTNSSNADLFLVRDDGNVGIGTASPGYNLDSRGSFNLQVGTDFYLRQVSLAIWAQTDANNYVKINRDNSGILDLAASNSASMFVAGTNEAISVSTAAATVRHNTAVYFRRTDNYAYGYWDTVNYRLRIGSLGTSPTAANTTLDVTGDISTRGTYPSAGGTLNDYSTSETSFLSISATSTTTITGFANGSNGKRLVVANNGTAEIILKHQDTGSSAANRLTIYNPLAGSTGDYTLVIDDTVEFIYDSSKSTWRKIN